MYLRETLKQAHMKHIRYMGNGLHLLENLHTGKREIWATNKNHAGYALIYKNTELEFYGEEVR